MRWLIVPFILSLRVNVVEFSEFDQSGVLVIEVTEGKTKPISQTGARVYSWELD